jgi:uncharacterized protein YjbK
MTTADHLEIEMKIRLASFMDYLKLIGHVGAIDREIHHINAFFDTPDRVLGKAGIALRVRATDESGSITLKSLQSQSDALAVRREVIAEIPAGEARSLIGGHSDLMVYDNEPVNEIRDTFPDISPLVLLKFRNTRQVKKYRLADRDLLLEIDKTEFADGSVEYELEIELEHESHFEHVREGLRRMFNSLAIPFEAETRSKFERALSRM